MSGGGIDRAGLTRLVKQYRLGSLSAAGELVALGTTRIEELYVAFGKERAPEEAIARVTETREERGDDAVAELVATSIERKDRADRQRAREDARALRVLDPAQLSTPAIVAACSSRAPFVIVPADPTTVLGVDARALRAIARDLAKRGRTATWSLNCTTVHHVGIGWLRVDWTTDGSRGHMRLALRAIASAELLEWAGDEDLAAFAAGLCAPATPAAPATELEPEPHAVARLDVADVDQSPALEPVPPSGDAWLAELGAELAAARAQLDTARGRERRPVAASRSEAARRAVETKRIRRLARAPGECLQRNGGRPMRHASDCPGCCAA